MSSATNTARTELADSNEDLDTGPSGLIRDNRAQNNLVGLMFGFLIAAVVAIEVVIPMINDMLASSNISGTTATILGLLGTFVALLLLITIASPLMQRV